MFERILKYFCFCSSTFSCVKIKKIGRNKPSKEGRANPTPGALPGVEFHTLNFGNLIIYLSFHYHFHLSRPFSIITKLHRTNFVLPALP